jgi:predicted ABC-type ATPase
MEKIKKTLYIIAGPNGSGKSTLAHQLLPVKMLEFLNADEIALEINPEAIDKVKITAGKEYFKRLKTFFDNEKSFIIETTLSGQTLEKTIQKARELSYEIILVYVFIDNPQICIERIKVRVKKGGHNIPDEDVIRRYKRSKENWEKGLPNVDSKKGQVCYHLANGKIVDKYNWKK